MDRFEIEPDPQFELEILRMTTPMLNGVPRAGQAPRKSLAQQLDRMDQILDGLADGGQGAVVDAVRDAVGQAVQMALREVLAHPEVLARLAPAAAPPPPSNAQVAPV